MRGLTLQPTELQPRDVAECSSALQALRSDLGAIGHLLEPDDALGLHVLLALRILGEHVDQLGRRIERLEQAAS